MTKHRLVLRRELKGSPRQPDDLGYSVRYSRVKTGAVYLWHQDEHWYSKGGRIDPARGLEDAVVMVKSVDDICTDNERALERLRLAKSPNTTKTEDPSRPTGYVFYTCGEIADMRARAYSSASIRAAEQLVGLYRSVYAFGVTATEASESARTFSASLRMREHALTALIRPYAENRRERRRSPRLRTDGSPANEARNNLPGPAGKRMRW